MGMHVAKQEPNYEHRRSTLSDRVYGKIVENMLEDKYPEGAKLPSEAELARINRVSRPVVRQALARLRDDGLIRSHKGAGSFVRRRPDQTMLSFAPLDSIADMQRCFEFRSCLEPEAAKLAALRGDGEAILKIKAAIYLLERRIQAGDLGVDADFAFHLAVAQATGNRFFPDTLNSLKEQITFGQNLARNLGLRRPRGYLPEVQEEHHSIYIAIRDQRVEDARERMSLHLTNSRSRVFEG